MVSVSYSRLLLSVVFVMLALEYSTANFLGGTLVTKREWLRANRGGKYASIQHDAKFLRGRKMLQELDEKNAQNKDEMLNQNVVHKHDYHVTKKKNESKSFLEAADEVAKLMVKDYGHGTKPRRKPPINNHEPKD
ncbi:hypothetical protein ACP275_08G035700 [Erythranthe tilingii]